MMFTTDVAKLVKGERYGYLSAILYLAPHTTAGYATVCRFSTPGCRLGCLWSSGRGQMNSVMEARIRKTTLLYEDYRMFLAICEQDILHLLRTAAHRQLRLAVRVNGTSDLPHLTHALARHFPTTQFYDYTKFPFWSHSIPPNVYYTFSQSEKNARLVQVALQRGHNVAVVFHVRKGDPLPKKYKDHRVIDGDEHDLRFLDPPGVIVGLRAKGKARRDDTGFVVHP